jgi:hypothetical protein
MKTFKTYKAAVAAAGEQDIIEIKIRSRRLYIVPGEGYHDALEEIAILSLQDTGVGVNRKCHQTAGHISPHHLKRLGNANHALSRQEVAAL